MKQNSLICPPVHMEDNLGTFFQQYLIQHIYRETNIPDSVQLIKYLLSTYNVLGTMQIVGEQQ
jgi:hypothetical protein